MNTHDDLSRDRLSLHLALDETIRYHTGIPLWWRLLSELDFPIRDNLLGMVNSVRDNIDP